MIAGVCADGGILCKHCINAEQERIARADPDCPDKWRIVETITELDFKGEMSCDHCNSVIVST